MDQKKIDELRDYYDNTSTAPDMDGGTWEAETHHLPATLATVDDVRQVCEAAGLMQFSDGSPVWRSGRVVVEMRPRVVVVWSTYDASIPDQRVAEMPRSQPGFLLHAAIRAARGES
jgi:hypothetical protein